jgi:hypothetical protein
LLVDMLVVKLLEGREAAAAALAGGAGEQAGC